MASLIEVDAALCDPDGDGEPNCGLGAWGEDDDCQGAAPNQQGTAAPMALFEKLTSQVGRSFYVGCYKDSGTRGPNYQSIEGNAAYVTEPAFFSYIQTRDELCLCLGISLGSRVEICGSVRTRIAATGSRT